MTKTLRKYKIKAWCQFSWWLYMQDLQLQRLKRHDEQGPDAAVVRNNKENNINFTQATVQLVPLITLDVRFRICRQWVTVFLLFYIWLSQLKTLMLSNTAVEYNNLLVFWPLCQLSWERLLSWLFWIGKSLRTSLSDANVASSSQNSCESMRNDFGCT